MTFDSRSYKIKVVENNLLEKASVIYADWADELKRLGLSQPAVLFLRALTPFTYLFAQILYFSQPLIGSLLQSEQRQALITLVEDPVAYHKFMALLNRIQEGNHD
ncbi:MAG: hypothetical protein C0391_01740 [Anaerolinea sp.]|nr:hypothetical protein [Anaerolinea sp.]